MQTIENHILNCPLRPGLFKYVSKFRIGEDEENPIISPPEVLSIIEFYNPSSNPKSLKSQSIKTFIEWPKSVTLTKSIWWEN